MRGRGVKVERQGGRKTVRWRSMKIEKLRGREMEGHGCTKLLSGLQRSAEKNSPCLISLTPFKAECVTLCSDF